ncbi:MmgE/PrpD family protein [Rhodococcus sp. BP-349]|uniref:MmgE/PrpD family protein n=1 Tax=unclassified Rhodococcus (in: high G+C Gram-positive bacteria) TaxID=192944 RepID=UPI001C9BAFD5|nr:MULTISPECIES: MmgE/PrpD family protein [unclassified Rhodococcus (in: high G+C Gram-positive bacteria)]MBY6539965.1 MmgE/PrpD family protein [Rhodococcus sp. BP-363]MBY6543707.1 MmgE/PrpD family protein [Rhodococcus sp. BP-369]MBY6562937.1 MmgE/PrpD family protein [Rhodococcus sp. BP-370]MBY6577229.1 MmgE/PrpD family protein [Rhodococcus sp. BP-364]MBY6586530.1 MmgE/PrpD family protein [Rhodococcus sp. BP-358]
MTESTLARTLAEFAVEHSFDDLPADVVDSIGLRVLDTLGIAIAATELDTSAMATAWAREQGGRAVASAVGVEENLPPTLAAFVNGVLAHSLDFDDTHLPSVLHPSASVVPAALAAAQQHGASGRDLVRGIAIGLEVCVRLGMAGFDPETKNSVFFENGQHATSICGAMGGAVAAAVIGGASADGIVDTLGIAASMAAGIIEANRTGGTVKRMHCGWAAHSAVSAAGLARHGITGPPTVLEGRFGFFQAWLHQSGRAAEITDGLGSTWAAPGLFVKPYPANHFTHAALDAAAALRNRGIAPADVEKYVLGVPAANLRTIGEPIEVKRTPQTGYMAQFSGPYAVAVGMLGGGGLGAVLDDYTDEKATSTERRDIMARVDVVPDAQCDAIFPHQFPAVLTAHLTDGTTVVEEVLTTRGGPERPLSFEDVRAKFTANVDGLLSVQAADAFAAQCAGLADLEDPGVLFDSIRTLGI